MIKDFPNHPCTHCSSITYLKVEGNIEEESGWECHSCGKEFIPDEH